MTPSPNLRTRLREATHETHAALERALDLLNPSRDVINYRDLLVRFYGYYRPLEAAMRAALAPRDQGLMAGRWKSAALAADLAALGMDPAYLNALPFVEQTPSLASAAEVIGAMYVVEGSTLGGTVLARHFADRLGLTHDRGLAFFTIYGERTGDMWQRYLASLAAFDNPRDADRVLNAATATFDALATWLTDDVELRTADTAYA